MLTHFIKKVYTTLNFHPNFPNNNVIVGISQDCLIPRIYYVKIVGADDTMLCSTQLTFVEAKAIYDSLEEINSDNIVPFINSPNNNGFPSKRVCSPIIII